MSGDGAVAGGDEPGAQAAPDANTSNRAALAA
jgi:hypothetical protein